MSPANSCFSAIALAILQLAPAGRAAPPDEIRRIAILACHKQEEPAPALVRYIEAQPDLCLWIGDNIYADTPDDPEVLRAGYRALAAKPAFRALRAVGHQLATWDDHDFGLNDAGGDYPLKQASKAIFREFWNHLDRIPEDQPGIYHARIFGCEPRRLQVILLDPRYNREAPFTDGDTLGEHQWHWLEHQLRQPAELRLVVSGYQILLPDDTRSETWARFPSARRRLFDTIRRTGAEGVVFVTGDQHYGEVARMPHAVDYDAVELQFAGINQIENPERNPLRVSPASTSLHSIALIDIQWSESDSEVPHLLYTVRDALSLDIDLTYRLNFSELRTHLRFEGPSTFVERTAFRIKHDFPHLTVRYTLDGSDPTSESPAATIPIPITETTTVRARFFDEHNRPRPREFSATVERRTPVPPELPGDGRALRTGLLASYAEGPFERIPDFRSLNVIRRALVPRPDLSSIELREDHFALRFQGRIRTPRTGIYRFFLTSDDGSRLEIAGRVVVDNDGSHSTQMRSGEIALEAGWHPFQLDYFEDYDGEVLHLAWEGPGIRRERVPDSAFGVEPLREAP